MGGNSSLLFMSLEYYQADSSVCLASSFSPFFLPNFLPNSSFPLFGMIISPKNVFLQVFNTLGFEARSKWLLCLCFVVLNASCIKSPQSPGLCVSSSPKLNLHSPAVSSVLQSFRCPLPLFLFIPLEKLSKEKKL